MSHTETQPGDEPRKPHGARQTRKFLDSKSPKYELLAHGRRQDQAELHRKGHENQAADCQRGSWPRDGPAVDPNEDAGSDQSAKDPDPFAAAESDEPDVARLPLLDSEDNDSERKCNHPFLHDGEDIVVNVGKAMALPHEQEWPSEGDDQADDSRHTIPGE